MTETSLKGQVAIVTGAARRIGRATAIELGRMGAQVVVTTGSSVDEAHETARLVEAAGSSALVHVADITSEAGVAGLVSAALARFGRIDGIVNNAALRSDQAFLDMSLADWRQITGVVLDGAFLLSRAALPSMLARGSGRIINVGGLSAHLGAKDRAHVVTSKAAIVGFTKALSAEFAGQGITVNCVVPGRIGGQRSATSGRGIKGDPPVGFEGTAEDVARAIAFLCAPGQRYITGQTLHVNGGLFMP